MSHEQLQSEGNALDRIAGITGLGWTVSILGYLGTILGYGTHLVSRIAEPHLLLYFGGVLFATTLGLDRLRNKLSTRKGN